MMMTKVAHRDYYINIFSLYHLFLFFFFFSTAQQAILTLQHHQLYSTVFSFLD